MLIKSLVAVFLAAILTENYVLSKFLPSAFKFTYLHCNMIFLNMQPF